MIKKQKNIVVIGGGTGTYTVLSGLKKYPVNLTAIVSMADDGGSTKQLREEFGVLPPGSVRPAMVALSNAEESLAKLFEYRFDKGGGLNGHNFGNLFLTALTNQLGSFEKALEEAGKLLKLQGQVIPSTLEHIHLVAKLENGKIITGEHNIDVPSHDGMLKIKEVWVEPKARANTKALLAIKKADAIIIGPGDLYSSILPNFLLGGMKEAVQKSRAKKIYVCNLMTKFGETHSFHAKDFVAVIEQYIGEEVIDYVFLNSKRPSFARIKKYEKEKAEFVEYGAEDFKGKNFEVVRTNLLRPQGFIRHDSDKLARQIIKIMGGK
ncbi:MAG: YvcK family protein [bacterium]|nr:YvcK family protein [bacterium]